MNFTIAQQNTLNNVQNAEIEILKELDKICKKHSLNYSLSGGTLLGAIRHKDFIPWDDDIDIDIPINDYKKLLLILPQELPDNLEVVEYNSHNGYFCDFITRITMKNSKCVNSYTIEDGNTIANDEKLNRVFIELYPVCPTASGIALKKQLFDIKKIYGYAMAHRYKNTDNSGYSFAQKAETGILKAIGSGLNINKIFDMYENTINRYPYGELLFKPSVPIPVLEKNVFDKEFFAQYTQVEIRGNMFSAPKEYIKVLESLYGDWRQLPPEQDRKPSHYNLNKVEIF